MIITFDLSSVAEVYIHYFKEINSYSLEILSLQYRYTGPGLYYVFEPKNSNV